MTKDTTLSIRISSEMRAQLETIAAAECRSLGAQALHFIKLGLAPTKVAKVTKVKLERPNDVSQQTWIDYIEIRRAKKTPITDTALDEIRKQATIAGWSLNDALNECCSRGWAGFKAEWVQSGKQNAVEQANRRSVEDFLNG